MSRGRPSRQSHGDAGYARKQRCPCQPCRLAERRYNKRLNFDHAQGRKRRQDAEPVRAHIQGLRGQGIELHQIATAAGLYLTVVTNIVEGNKSGWTGQPAKWVLPGTARKILAVTYEEAARVRQLVPSIGIHRRIQALEYLGHPKSAVAAELGVTESQVHLYLKRDLCWSDTIPAIHAAYLRMRTDRGPSEYARWGAYRRNWPGPWAWDDETIDDPEARPQGQVCVVAICSRKVKDANLCATHLQVVKARNGFNPSRNYKQIVDSLGRKQRHEPAWTRGELKELKEQGVSPQLAAQRLGMGEAYVEKVWYQL